MVGALLLFVGQIGLGFGFHWFSAVRGMLGYRFGPKNARNVVSMAAASYSGAFVMFR